MISSSKKGVIMWLVDRVFGKSVPDAPELSKTSREFGLLKFAISLLALSSQVRPVFALDERVITLAANGTFSFPEVSFSALIDPLLVAKDPGKTTEPSSRLEIGFAVLMQSRLPPKSEYEFNRDFHQYDCMIPDIAVREEDLKKDQVELALWPDKHELEGDLLVESFTKRSGALITAASMSFRWAEQASTATRQYEQYLCAKLALEELIRLRKKNCPAVTTHLLVNSSPREGESDADHALSVQKTIFTWCGRHLKDTLPTAQEIEQFKEWVRQTRDEACKEDTLHHFRDCPTSY